MTTATKEKYRIDRWELDQKSNAFVKIDERFTRNLKAMPPLHDGAAAPRFNVVHDLAGGTAYVKEHTGSLNDGERLREFLATGEDPKQAFHSADSHWLILKQDAGWSCDWLFQSQAKLTPAQWRDAVTEARQRFASIAGMPADERRQLPVREIRAYAFGLETYLVHRLRERGILSVPHSSMILRYPG
jgi:hypothetical protein